MTAQSNTNSSITSAKSISAKLDSVSSAITSLNSRLAAIEAKIDALGSKFDAINNAIDSLENVIVTTINGLKDILLLAINGLYQQFLAFIDLIKSLFGGRNQDRTDEILSKLSKIETDIDDLFTHFDDALNYNGELIKAAITKCCNELARLINNLIKDKDDNEILDIIRQIEGRIKESIGGSENRIIGEINQNESKLDTIINKLGDKDADWVTRILAAISALASLLKDNKCDLNQVIINMDGWGKLLEALIRNINCDFDSDGIKLAIDSSKNQLAIKIDGNTNILNNLINDIQYILNEFNDENNSQIINYLTTNNNTYNNDYINNTVNNAVTNTVNNAVTNAVSNLVNNHLNNFIDQITNLSVNNIIQSVQQYQDNYVSIKVPIFVTCNDGEPEFAEEVVSVKVGTEALEYSIFNKLAKIEAIKCTKIEPVAIIPEWWQLRLEGDVPQFVIAFGEVDELTGKCLHAKYPMTIPHFKDVKPLSCPVPRYKKGNYELLGIMKDNSKLIINAFSEYECERVFNSIFPFLDPNFSSSLKYKIGKRVGYQFKEIWVCPRFGKYFSHGTKDTNPDWTVYF